MDNSLEKVQQVQLEILLEFDRICKKNNINYQLFAGTLLGAIRHKGFIPWDDDIDVCLLRNDYERFLAVCEEELDPQYFLQTNKSDQNYIMQFAKIRKNNTVFLEKATANCHIHNGIYIDVFPLDGIRPNSFIGAMQQKLLLIIGRINLTRIKNLCTDTEMKLQKMIRLSFHYLMKLIPNRLTNTLQKKVCCMFQDYKETEYVSHLTNGASSIRVKKYVMKKNEFYNTIEGEFEGHKFPIPVEYDKVLKKLYGDYKKHPPVEERMPHHGVIEIKFNLGEE